jgi:Bacterial regulatory protein, Fis family
MQDQAGAASSAILAIDGAGYVVWAATELVEADFQRITLAWADSRTELLTRHPIIEDEWALWPVGRPVTGLVYLGRAKQLSGELLRQLMTELAPLLEISLSVRDQEPEARMLYQALIERTPLRQLAREKLLVVLRAHDWNKTRAARALGVTRATLYKWLRKHGLAEAEGGAA